MGRYSIFQSLSYTYFCRCSEHENTLRLYVLSFLLKSVPDMIQICCKKRAAGAIKSAPGKGVERLSDYIVMV